MVQGVNSAQTSQSTQQTLFSNQSQSTSSSEASSSQKSDDQAGSVKQQAKVSVLKESMETKEQNVMKLLNSTQGVGQNIDTFA